MGGSLCIRSDGLRTSRQASSPSKKQSLNLMNYKLLRCLIICLLKEARRQKRKRLKRMATWQTPTVDSFPQTFVIESFFTRELIRVLTPTANEEMHFLTGPKLGPI